MDHTEIRKKFRDFFEKRGHKWVESSSLLPTDPSVLFTTAGMQQFKPYYIGEADAMKDFGSLNTVSIQKCVRTSDIDEVGDESHLTFFEMLGNFSFGGYFKEKAIEYSYDFITKEMGLKIDYVSVFGGEDGISADEESEKYWKAIDPDVKVVKAGRKDNFWGPTGDEGPCGPTTEIYVKTVEGKSVEVWNIVFNQYYQYPDKRLEPLKIPGIDTGMGLERLAMMAQGKKNIFETDLFDEAFEMYRYIADSDDSDNRVFMDHVRAVIFSVSDGFRPSNKDSGYVIRRLIRRIVTILKVRTHTGSITGHMFSVLDKVINFYEKIYKNLAFQREAIKEVFKKESDTFEKTLEQGLKEFYRRYPGLEAQRLEPGKPVHIHKTEIISGKDAFDLHQSYGFTIDVLKDLGKDGLHTVDEEGFWSEYKKHQELSRTASAGMFKGGLADTSVETTRLHTAAHLMLEALRRVLGDHIQQKGSNITPERLRFDFSHGEKVTPEQIQKIEEIVNEQIDKKLPVHFEEMSVDEAKKAGATGVFEHKYGDKVKVYFVGNDGDYFSKEICGGPHVSNTGEIGRFKIIKEESASAGTRRIKAIVE